MDEITVGELMKKKICMDCANLVRRSGFLKRFKRRRCTAYNKVIKYPHIADHDCMFFQQRNEKE